MIAFFINRGDLKFSFSFEFCLCNKQFYIPLVNIFRCLLVSAPYGTLFDRHLYIPSASLHFHYYVFQAGEIHSSLFFSFYCMCRNDTYKPLPSSHVLSSHVKLWYN